jgi:hypothetical protein
MSAEETTRRAGGRRRRAGAGRAPLPRSPGDPPPQKIPLPPLPHFRPREEIRTPVLEAVRPWREGDSGAAVLNDLVDQIERGIESHRGHVVAEGTLPAYRETVVCSHEKPPHRR